MGDADQRSSSMTLIRTRHCGLLVDLETRVSELSALVGEKEREKEAAESALPKLRVRPISPSPVRGPSKEGGHQARLRDAEEELAARDAEREDGSWAGLEGRLRSLGAALDAMPTPPPAHLDVYGPTCRALQAPPY